MDEETSECLLLAYGGSELNLESRANSNGGRLQTRAVKWEFHTFRHLLSLFRFAPIIRF